MLLRPPNSAPPPLALRSAAASGAASGAGLGGGAVLPFRSTAVALARRSAAATSGRGGAALIRRRSAFSVGGTTLLRRRPLRIRALDAAQPFDHETLAATTLADRSRLKIAIIGFGNFGQFLARTFAAQGHTLFAHSRTDHSTAARSLGATFFPDPHDLCEQHPDVVLLCSSILSAPAVLSSLPLQSLRRSTLFVDVLSVKEFPKNLLLQNLPPGFDILCTHPMFGPESAKNGWAGRPFVYDKVRIGDSEDRIARCNNFLNIFEKEGCRMVEMSCAEHDEISAEIQFLTHTVGRILAKLELKSTPINTVGYETLLNLVENTCRDSFELFNGLFMYNEFLSHVLHKNSTELLERLDAAFDSLKRELFGNLHDVLRKQLFESPSRSLSSSPKKPVDKVPEEARG